MFEKIKKNQRALMAVLIVVCMGIIAFSEYRCLSTLQDKLLFLLMICGILFLLIRSVNREIAEKNRDIEAKDKALAAKDNDRAAKDQAIAEKTNRLEYEARMFEAFAAYLSSSSNDVYLILNEDREVVYATPNLERVMCRSQEEIAAGLRDVDHSADTEELQKFVRQLRTLGPGESAGPVIREQVCAPTGERQYLLEQATCAHIQDKVQVVVYVSDRTREYKLREDLADALRRAQDANNAKNTFLKGVSHDMRTPMNAIIGFLGLMRNEVNNPDVVMEYAQQIDTASQHLMGLINNVMDMSKVESGGMSLNISELNVAEIVEEIRTIVTPQIQAKNQTFDISVSQLMHEYLLGDKVRIKEILLVKSAPGKGSTFTVELDMRISAKDVNPRFWMEHQVRRMLIVDNDEAACRVIVNAMAKSGVSADYATSGEAALRMVNQQRETGEPYNLILLDWMMPDLDGLETARRIRKDCRDQTPICLLTAYNWDDIKQEATEIGVNDFKPKPFFMSTFQNVVRRMMSRQRKVEESDTPADVIRDKYVMIVDDNGSTEIPAPTGTGWLSGTDGENPKNVLPHSDLRKQIEPTMGKSC